MPRIAKPRLGPRGWYANIGERDSSGKRAKEVYAPASIGPRDEAGAWEWFKAEKERRTERVVDPANLTVESICQL